MANNKVPPISIKTEPGAASAYKRLPSFRTPRDLKLTEFQRNTPTNDKKDKKVYVPNLNVQRRRSNEVSKSKAAISNDSSEKNVIRANEKAGGSKPDERNKKDTKDRRKKPGVFIQGSGVFSEGLAPNLKLGRWFSRNSESSSPMLEMPKLKKETVKIDKEEEAQVIKELLRDDFLDDPGYLPDLKNCPIRLPLNNFGGTIFAKKEEDETDVKPEIEVKTEMEEGSEVASSEADKGTLPISMSQMAPLSVQQLITQQATQQSYIFFQLPHCMPKQKTFLPSGTSWQEAPKEKAAKSSSSQGTTQPQPEEEPRSLLRSLPAGRIGKLQFLQSGKARLVLGDVTFIVDPGTQPAFKQDLLAVDLNQGSLSGNMVNIGRVTSRMIVSPDWQALLVK